jgi:hypothetical protein
MSEITPFTTNPTNLYELDLNDTESLFDDDSSYTPQALKAVQKPGVINWLLHRTVKFREDKLSWKLPISAAERAKGKKSPQEILPFHQFVAIRGIPLGFRYGFSLTEGSGDEFKVHCTTTKVEEHLGQNSRTIEDRFPLEIPLSRVYQKKAEPNQPNNWFNNHPHIEVYGSRPPVGMPESYSGTPRKCKDCVLAGEHYIGTEEEFKSAVQTPTCRMSGYLLFAVTHLGSQDSSELMNDPVNGKIKVTWQAVKDAKLTTEVDGQRVPLDRPFILKIEGLGSSQQSAIGTGQYDWSIETQADTNTSILPAVEKLYSAGDFFKYINDPRFIGIRSRKLNNGMLAYPVVTEVYTGKLKEEKNGSKYIPVFRPVTDPEVIDNGMGLKSQDWLISALQTLQYERSLVNANEQVLPPAAMSAALTPAVEEPTTKAKTKANKALDYLAAQNFEVFGKP